MWLSCLCCMCVCFVFVLCAALAGKFSSDQRKDLSEGLNVSSATVWYNSIYLFPFHSLSRSVSVCLFCHGVSLSLKHTHSLTHSLSLTLAYSRLLPPPPYASPLSSPLLFSAGELGRRQECAILSRLRERIHRHASKASLQR